MRVVAAGGVRRGGSLERRAVRVRLVLVVMLVLLGIGQGSS
jgi:hypothetical protein